MKWTNRTVLVVIAVGACSAPSFGADHAGNFVTGGGVGSLHCTEFLNSMRQARELGGLTSPAGANYIQGWSEYVLGFQTAYNYATNGVRDVFGAFGLSPANDVLYGIEPWCEKNPTEKFADALILFADRLREGHNLHSEIRRNGGMLRNRPLVAKYDERFNAAHSSK